MKCTILDYEEEGASYLITYRSKKKFFSVYLGSNVIRLYGIKIIKSKNMDKLTIRAIRKKYGRRMTPHRTFFKGLSVDVLASQNLMSFSDVESALLLYDVL